MAPLDKRSGPVGEAQSRSAGAAACTTQARALLQRRCSTDADEHAEALALWDQHYEQLTPGRFSGDLSQAWFDDVQIFREVTNQVVFQAGCSWPGAATLGVVLDMQGEGTFCDRPLRPRSGFVFGAPGEFTLRTPECFDVVGIAVSERLVAEAARQTQDAGLERFAAAGRETLPPGPPMEAVRGLVLGFFDAMATDPSPLAQAPAQHAFVSSLLGAIAAAADPGTDAMPAAATASARSRVVEFAKAHILAQRETPLTVADLCGELGVSRRTLQYCFQEVLGVSPVQYLRAVRLNGVRRELKRPRSSERVGDVAARWGFWHLSQFSADYRRMFGELPSETRRAASS